jgi:hypothetical protein
MQASPPPSPIDFPKFFYPKLRSRFFLFVISALFLYGWWFLIPPEEFGAIVYYVAVVFFAGGAIVALAMMFPGTSYLRLDDAGFMVRIFGRETFTRWEDVERFFVIKQKVNGLTTTKFVGMEFSPSHPAYAKLRTVRRALAPCDNMIDPLGQKAEDLADLMNQCRERAVSIRRSV